MADSLKVSYFEFRIITHISQLSNEIYSKYDHFSTPFGVDYFYDCERDSAKK